MIKCIVSDLDGTLINENHILSKITQEGIKDYINQGMQFIIATGRDYLSASPIFENTGIDMEMILLNGAQVRKNDGEIIDNYSLTHEQIRKITSVFNEYGLLWNAYAIDGSCSIFSCKDLLKSFVKAAKVVGFCREDEEGEEHRSFFDETRVYANVEELLEKEQTILKIETHEKDVEKLLKVKLILDEIEEIAVASSFVINLEITHREAQKGITLKKVLDKLGIKEDEVVVVGDSLNDITMLEMFDYSYAVANACEEAKTAAHYGTRTNLEDGVLYAVKDAIAKSEQN